MKKIAIFILVFITVFSVQAKIIDKIVAVVDDSIITLSMVERVKTNLVLRNNIAPFLYENKQYTNSEIAEKAINTKVIRDKLAEFGYVISDDQVEGSVNQRIQGMRLTKDQLINILKQNNMTFDEYFSFTKELLEYSLFIDRVISPLISITDQEIKNAYYKKNQSNKTLAFKYDLVDFYLAETKLDKNSLKEFKNVLAKFQVNGVLPKAYEGVETNTLGEMTEEFINSDLKKLLKIADEGSFTEPLLLNSYYHVFFVKKKDLVESEDYKVQKNELRMELVNKATEEMTKIWLKRQVNSHYVKFFE